MRTVQSKGRKTPREEKMVECIMYMCAAVDRCELTGQETGGPRQVVDLSNEDVVFRGLLFPPVTSRR